MARIIYALSGEGHGHVSRVMAMAELLRAHGHELFFCCGGVSEQVLRAKGEPVHAVPALQHAVYRNKLRPYSTFLRNLPQLVQQPLLVDTLSAFFYDWKPDLLINDFEAFSWRAAEKNKIPVIALSPQQILTHLPRIWRHEPFASYAKITANYIQARNAVLEVIPTYFDMELTTSDKTVFVPPIIRPEIKALHPQEGEHILVYLNRNAGIKKWIHELSQLRNYSFIVYGYSHEEVREGNLWFKPHSLTTFLEDLATSQAVICTAGFTLISEALYLRKPILAVPNRGQYEQWLNAHFLEKQGWGNAVYNAIPSATEIEAFLENSAILKSIPFLMGNEQAWEQIKPYLS